MRSGSSSRRRVAATAGVAAAALVLTACGGSSNNSGSSGGGGGTLTIGTSDKITTLDPAGAYDNGSFTVMNQVYPFLMNTSPGHPDVQPDIATSASFTSRNEKSRDSSVPLASRTVTRRTVPAARAFKARGSLTAMRSLSRSVLWKSIPASLIIEVTGMCRHPARTRNANPPNALTPRRYRLAIAPASI